MGVQTMNYPQSVEWLLKKLEQEGYRAWLVGGALRDSLLGKIPKDWDVATVAPVARVLELLKDQARIVPTGLKHGTVTVIRDDLAVEVTELRAEDLTGDLGGRDFTINALAWSREEGFIDPWGGQEDLQQRIIRATVSPRERFQEDPLRLLRVVRFAVQLDFTIDKDTYQQLKEQAALLTGVSPERIREELVKILVSPRPAQGMELLQETGLLKTFLPEIEEGVGFNQHHHRHHKDVFGHTLLVLEQIPPQPLLRLAALFHDVAKPRTFSLDSQGVGHFYGHDEAGAKLTGQIMRRLRFDTDTIQRVKNLVQNHTLSLSYPNIRPHKIVHSVGLENLDHLFALQRADKLGGSGKEEDLAKIQAMAEKVQQAIENKEPLHKSDLAITGHDLIKLGFEGKALGQTLAKLLDLTVKDPTLNQRDTLLAIARDTEASPSQTKSLNSSTP
jgi:tRNA nucleotidyltransferase (CCA-adding enzyme)